MDNNYTETITTQLTDKELALTRIVARQAVEEYVATNKCAFFTQEDVDWVKEGKKSVSPRLLRIISVVADPISKAVSAVVIFILISAILGLLYLAVEISKAK